MRPRARISFGQEPRLWLVPVNMARLLMSHYKPIRFGQKSFNGGLTERKVDCGTRLRAALLRHTSAYVALGRTITELTNHIVRYMIKLLQHYL